MAEDYPPGFPQMTLGIMRAVCALTVLHPGKEGQGILCEVLDALFKSSWVERRKTNEKEVLEEVLGGVLGREEAGKGMLSISLHTCLSCLRYGIKQRLIRTFFGGM